MKGWFISETITRKSTGDITLHQYEVNNMKIYTLSSLIDNHQLFCKFAQDAYSATDCLCQDYPKYFEWYWSKNFPRVFNGTGEIVVCIIDDNIAGIASLKKINTEKKICTFFVVKEYRGQHVATKMLEYIFEYLGTSKPLIIITDYKVLSFVPIIKKYNWKLTQITSKGYYNNASCEFVSISSFFVFLFTVWSGITFVPSAKIISGLTIMKPGVEISHTFPFESAVILLPL